MPLDEQIKRLQTVQAAAPVRTRLLYQNTMFEIAGLVIKRISGKAWEQFLTERLWQPIGMQNTFGDRSSIGDRAHVMPHLYNNEKLSVTKWDLAADYTNAAGSVWSSIHDMSLWAQFLLRDGVTYEGKRLISKSSIKQMFEPHQLSSESDFYPTTKLTKPNWRSYGLGWFQQDFQGRKIDFHTGSLSGLIALIGLDRENDKAVIVLGNRDHAEMRHALLWEVMDNTGSDTRRDWNQEIFDLFDSAADSSDKKWQETQENRLKNTKPALSLANYAGDYENESFGDIQLVKKGKKLTLKTKLIDFNMSYWHLDTYLIEKKSWKMKEFVTFNISADGKVTSFNVFGETIQRKKAEQVTE
jgi:CubicO group peptidase (beta-lactamase class C family)